MLGKLGCDCPEAGMCGMGLWEESALETTASTNFNCWDSSQADNASQQSGNGYQDFLSLYERLACARVSSYLKEIIKEDFVIFIISKDKTFLTRTCAKVPCIFFH